MHGKSFPIVSSCSLFPDTAKLKMLRPTSVLSSKTVVSNDDVVVGIVAVDVDDAGDAGDNVVTVMFGVMV